MTSQERFTDKFNKVAVAQGVEGAMRSTKWLRDERSARSRFTHGGLSLRSLPGLERRSWIWPSSSVG